MRKIIAGLLTFCMSLQMAFVVSAQTKYASVDYSSGTGVYENLSIKNASDYEIVDTGNGYALKLLTSSVLGTCNISYSIKSSMLDTMFEDCLKVTLSYYDKGNGSFSFTYLNRNNTSVVTDPVWINNTGDIKEVTYNLYDFSSEYNTFNIGLYNSNMAQSVDDVYIKGIKIEKTGNTFPINQIHTLFILTTL